MNYNKWNKAKLIQWIKDTELINKAKDNGTKSINKIKHIGTNTNNKINSFNSYLNSIWQLIVTIKDILVKLTFLSLVMKIYRRHKIIKLFFRFLNWIIISIFGISILDQSGVELFHKIWIFIGDTAMYILDYVNWVFGNIKSLFSKPKVEIVNETPEPPEMLLNNYNLGEEDIKEEKSTNYKKYLIIAGIIITAGLVWYYYDDISNFFGGRRPPEGDGNRFGWYHDDLQRRIEANRARAAEYVRENRDNISMVSDDDDDINLIDDTDNFQSGSDVKLEDLRKPENIPLPSSPNSSSGSITPKASNIKLDESPVDDSSVTPSDFGINVSEITSNWKNFIDNKELHDMKFIEKAFNEASIQEVSIDTSYKVVDKLVDIVIKYNQLVENYEIILKQIGDSEKHEIIRIYSYEWRKWINEYYFKTFPDSQSIIEIGTINDAPKLIDIKE